VARVAVAFRSPQHRARDQCPSWKRWYFRPMSRRAQDPVVVKLDAAPLDDEELTEDHQAIMKALKAPGINWTQAVMELNAD
jgi:hypothetical protein